MNMSNRKRNHPAGKCVQCAILLWILERMDIDAGTPPSCEAAYPENCQSMKTRKEVMFMLDIDPSTYTRWIKQGILIPRVVGSRHFYTDADLQRALEECARRGKR